MAFPRAILPVLLPWAALSVASCAADGQPSPAHDAETEEVEPDERPSPAAPSDAAVDQLDATGGDAQLDASAPHTGTLDASELDAASLDEAGREACVPDGGSPRLGTAVVEHACLHGKDGPFRVVDAGSSSQSAPDVSRPHTLFTVLGAVGATFHVRYVPSTTGDHVLFVARGELVEARQGASSLLPERALVDCNVLPVSYVLQLVSSEPVELALRADSERVAMVIESLSGWGSEAWTGSCSAPAAAPDGGLCRKSGPCASDSECCSYCHDYDHCH